MARELLLRGGYVVTVDDSLRGLPNGDVLIRDDQVAAVGRNLSTFRRDAEVLDVAGRLSTRCSPLFLPYGRHRISGTVKAVKMRYLDPHRDEILHEFLHRRAFYGNVLSVAASCG